MGLSSRQWLVLGFAAVAVFWMLGAHNRLVALRNAIAAAWAKVDDALRQRAAAAEPLLAALREPLAGETGALDALAAALAESARAAAAMGTRPVVVDNASAWVAAETALAAAAARVFALFEHDAELRSREDVAPHAATWRDAGTRLNFARQLFNDEAAAYNDAVTLFPTRLLAPMFRFGLAGRI